MPRGALFFPLSRATLEPVSPWPLPVPAQTSFSLATSYSFTSSPKRLAILRAVFFLSYLSASAMSGLPLGLGVTARNLHTLRPPDGFPHGGLTSPGQAPPIALFPCWHSLPRSGLRSSPSPTAKTFLAPRKLLLAPPNDPSLRLRAPASSEIGPANKSCPERPRALTADGSTDGPDRRWSGVDPCLP